MEKQELVLHIENLSATDQKLITIVQFAMSTEDEEKYEKLAQIFSKRAEMIKIVKELNY